MRREGRDRGDEERGKYPIIRLASNFCLQRALAV